MKVTIVGNMCTWTKELSTSYILNDDMLIDLPQGSFKTLYNDYDLNKIDYLLITHFHSDHFADIHLLLDIFFKRFDNKKLTILAPKGCKERIVQMLKLFEVGYIEKYLDDSVTFLDITDRATYKLSPYKIKAFKMQHKSLDAYGFIISDGKVKVGFSGDSIMCNSVHKILKHSLVAFIDSASVEPNNSHLTVKEVEDLSKEYSEVKIYPVHLSYKSQEELEKTGLEKTYPGQVVEIE